MSLVEDGCRLEPFRHRKNVHLVDRAWQPSTGRGDGGRPSRGTVLVDDAHRTD
jgi:hypothetical protein